MQGKQRTLLRSSVVAILLVTFTTAFWNVSGRNTTPAHAENNGVATTPFMGWSTWSFDGGYPTASNVEAQANVEASKLKSAGYNYVLLDDHYYLNPGTTVDQYGRWQINSAQFPNGIAAVASYVHSLGLKFGIYVTPGIPVAAVNQNTPIQGTSYHARDAANTSKYQNNYGGFGNVMYYLNYSSPAAQDFINSWADEYASWGVDFLKIDAVGDWNQQDVADWSIGLQQSGRPIVFDLSNTLDRSNINFWRQYSNAWRIEGDVQCYSACSTLVDWSTVSTRFKDAPAWAPLAAPGGWNDLDSLNIADGAKDGITNDERQTYMTLWSIEAAPLYAGDDLTTMDSYGLSLLTNSEVVAVDQRGKAAVPVSQSSNQQVWYTNNGDGSYTVALFNLAGSSSNVTANWSNFGFSGSATVRDLWSHTNLGTFNGSFSATLNTHASRLLKVVPTSGGVTPTPTPSSGFTPTPGAHYRIVNHNSGQNLDVSGASTANGGLIDQWPTTGGTNQEWSFTAVNGGYKLVNVNSGLLLDNPNGSTTNGTQLDQWNDTNGSNQWWNLVSTGNGYYSLVNQKSGQYADVTGASTANGAAVIQWPGPGGTNQQWSFVQV
ncbi:MAG TPA: RICIN domain-containing protein [Ktedonobacteraceae bacterium]